MSSTPTPYTRQADFTSYEVENPSAPKRGTDLDAEFDAVVVTAGDIASRLSEIQRDDGQLRNLSVHPDALSDTVRAMFAAEAGVIRGDWATGTTYASKDVVTDPTSDFSYIAVTAHVAGATFAADLAAGRWLQFGNDVLLRTQLASTTGGTLVGFRQTGTAVDRTLNAKALDAVATIKDFGATADGVTSDNVAVTAAEASDYPFIDLCGETVKTTLAPSVLTKGYFNGTLLVAGAVAGNPEPYKLRAPVSDLDIARPRTKSPVVDWTSKAVLWLGTSIPHQGVGIDGYPELFARALACSVDNQAWAGSAAQYSAADDAFAIDTVKRLSMTEDDRLAGLALHGSSSAYSDTFDLITKPSSMTCDSRIASRFSATPFDVVVLDHAHNDRGGELGTLTPESQTITGIAVGATTAVTLNTIGTIAVGDAIALEVTGISFLNHAAARVQSVVGNQVTLNIDSSAYVGVFASGTAYKLDRNTIYGAWEFLIHYIKNQGTKNGKDTKIILAGAPSEYTNGVKDNGIWAIAEAIRDVADKWDIAFFDIGHQLSVGPNEHAAYFPDNVHPTTTATRQALANHWVEWARGGAPLALSSRAYIPANPNGSGVYTENREALYSRFEGGFTTPNFVLGTYANLITETFPVSTAGWTSAGGAAPTVVDAPWGVGKALSSAISPPTSTTAAIYKTIAPRQAMRATFDLWLSSVTGLTDLAAGGQFAIASFNSNGSTRYLLSLVVRKTGVSFLLRCLTSFGGVFVTVPLKAFQIDANTKYTIKMEAVTATATYSGGMLLYVNNVLISEPLAIADSSWGSAPNRFYVGVSGSTTAKAGTVHFGNVVVDDAAVNDYTKRFTGTFTTADAKTATVVNGIIVTCA